MDNDEPWKRLVVQWNVIFAREPIELIDEARRAANRRERASINYQLGGGGKKAANGVACRYISYTSLSPNHLILFD